MNEQVTTPGTVAGTGRNRGHRATGNRVPPLKGEPVPAPRTSVAAERTRIALAALAALTRDEHVAVQASLFGPTERVSAVDLQEHR